MLFYLSTLESRRYPGGYLMKKIFFKNNIFSKTTFIHYGVIKPHDFIIQ